MKLSAHQLGSSNSSRPMLALGGKYIKIVEAFGEIPGLRRDFPDVKIIGRKYSHPDWSAELFDPIIAAETDFNAILAEHQKTPCNYWESGNEIIPNNYAEMAKIAQYDIRFMQLCEQHNMKAVIGNFATGTPGKKIEPISDAETIQRYWQAYKPALLKAQAGSHIIGLHEYIGDISSDTWLQYRYRRLIEFCKSNNIKINIFITECGKDDWKSLGEQRYAEILISYELGLRSDPEVLAGFVFTCGTNASQQWEPWNIDNTNIPTILANWNKNNPEKPPSVPTEQPKFSFPGSGLLMILYDKPNGKIMGTRVANWEVNVFEIQGQWWRVTKDYWVRMSFI